MDKSDYVCPGYSPDPPQPQFEKQICGNCIFWDHYGDWLAGIDREGDRACGNFRFE